MFRLWESVFRIFQDQLLEQEHRYNPIDRKQMQQINEKNWRRDSGQNESGTKHLKGKDDEMAQYIHFTDAQKDQARQVSLPGFLQSRGETVKRCGSEYVWMHGDEKITLRGNLWFNQYTREGGNAIDFARRFFDCSYKEAVTILLGTGAGTVIPSVPCGREKKPFALPSKNGNLRRVYAYLTKTRCVDPNIINYFVNLNMLYEDAEHHNCVFVGYDENSVPRHAHLRGTGIGSSYKGNIESCDPSYSFHITGDSDRLFVFEAPIDLLSFLTLYPNDWQKHSYVALCSVASYAAKQMLKQKPNITRVALCLDNDKAGNTACVRIEKELSELYPSLRIARLTPSLKDWNEDLQKACHHQKREAVQCPTGLIIVSAVMALVLGGATLLSHLYSLNRIRSRTVGDGQHGTARWATKREIRSTYRHVPFTPNRWRKGEKLPKEQGIVIGCAGGKRHTTALVDTGDVHALMIGAAGVGKTAYWLYPCIEYACATGMSFLSTDTKGDIMRNYGAVAKEKYGYHVSVIDLRNPTRSNGNNLLHLVNRYMDLYKEHPDMLVYKAKAEKYAKIVAKTIILAGVVENNFGQNSYFYDAAEGLLTATILLVAEFCEPQKRHVVSLFKIIQELLAPSNQKNKTQFQQIMDLLPDTHKAK